MGEGGKRLLFCFSDGISYSRIFFHDKSNGDIHFLLRRRSFKLHLRLKSEKGVKNVNKPIFLGENRNSRFWAALMGFFTYSRIFFHEKSNGDIHFLFLRRSIKLHLRLKSEKGVYLPFFGSKFKINYLGIFHWIFLYQVKKIIIIGPQGKYQH